VSLPEAPLLAVLPGTGGLTRVTDKRKVRRDLADVFSTLAEGVRGRRAVEWRLVDESVARSRFDAAVKARVDKLVARAPRTADGAGMPLDALRVTRDGDNTDYDFVSLRIDKARHVAEITVKAPTAAAPATAEALRAGGSGQWCVAAFRALDDALLDLRFNHLDVGLILLRTEGSLDAVLAHDAALHTLAATDWLAREVVLLQKRVLKRLDLTARSVFALVEKGSCFGGSLFELSLAADRTYMLDDEEGDVAVALSVANFGPMPMSNGLTRLATRFLYDPSIPARLREMTGRIDARDAAKAGPRHLHARPHRLGRRAARRHRGAHEPVARRDDRHGGEPALRRPREHATAKSLGASRPGKTGSSSAPTPWARPRRPLDVRQARPRPSFDVRRTLSFVSTPSLIKERPRTSDVQRDDRREDPQQRQPLLRPATAARPGDLAARLRQLVGARWAPSGFQEDEVYLRTAISVEQRRLGPLSDYVKMPDYRWGIFLTDAGAGSHHPLRRQRGKAGRGSEVPGELRNALRRIIVTQGRYRARERRAAAAPRA
jgi:hypothetical protein